MIKNKNKAMKYFFMLKAFKNIKKTDNNSLKTKHLFLPPQN